jgi:hypothetical protein
MNVLRPFFLPSLSLSHSQELERGYKGEEARGENAIYDKVRGLEKDMTEATET